MRNIYSNYPTYSSPNSLSSPIHSSSPSPEEKGLVISLGIIIAGNIVKTKNRDVGNFLQGVGIGTGLGTIAHILDSRSPDPLIPHHDIMALASIPITFILDKTNTIKNKDIVNNLYGIGIGTLSQHLLTEGCSFCGTLYCKNGDHLC